MSASLVTFLLLLGALVGFVVGWIAKRDFAQARIDANGRYWRARLAELESLLEQAPAVEGCCVSGSPAGAGWADASSPWWSTGTGVELRRLPVSSGGDPGGCPGVPALWPVV